MENSPLVKAHDHARAAAVATRQASDTTVAINEHTQAAGEFANAAKSTSSAEALRTLRLLEAHHQKLAELLKLPPDLLSQSGEDGDEKGASEKDGMDDGSGKKDEGGSAKGAHMPGLAKPKRSTSREMSSSIASNLASARGIRSKHRGHPLSPSVSNDQAPGNVDPHPRRDGSKTKMQTIMDHQSGKPTWVPPSGPPSGHSDRESRSGASSSTTDATQQPVEDAGYSKFYNTFGSLINKISAPLAFAGLPLIQEESTILEPDSPPEMESSRKPPKISATVQTEPDLSKIYSKSTMSALVRDGHAPHESFYVVPTTGHTMSYANILNYAEKEKRRLVSSIHGDKVGTMRNEEDEDFVDARESPISLAALSPGAKRRVGRGKTERELHNTIEELFTENQSLKSMLDKLSKRLQTFETSAQSSAMALAESYRLMRPASPSASRDDNASKKKSPDMDQQMLEMAKHMEALEKDNRKMQKTLEKYREKWDTLKAGAKARRDGQKTMDGVEDDG